VEPRCQSGKRQTCSAAPNALSNVYHTSFGVPVMTDSQTWNFIMYSKQYKSGLGGYTGGSWWSGVCGILRGQGGRWSLRSITGWVGPGFGRASRSGDLTDREMTVMGHVI
jgi:hypothetical protein